MAKRRKHETRAEVLAKLEAHRRKQAEAKGDLARLIATGAEAELIEAGTAVRARRIDVFQLLFERGSLTQEQFDAVRDHEADMATAMGWNTPERRPDHIRASIEGAPGQNISQAMVDASRMLEWVDKRLPTRDLALLKALLHENDANCGRWRGTVEKVTGESRDEAHSVAIRAMVENLRDVRKRFPVDERRMAA